MSTGHDMMTPEKKNIRDIVKDWLEKNGYDGLYGDECGCPLDDLMCCNEVWPSDCCAGYRTDCESKPEDCFAADCDGNMAYCIHPMMTPKKGE